MGPTEKKMSLSEHIDELRKCLIRIILGIVVGGGVCLCFTNEIMSFLFWPMVAANPSHPEVLRYSALTSPVTIYFKVALVVGVFVTAPYTLYQIWKFVGSGLRDNERRAVRRAVLPSVGLFVLGAAFFFFVLSPVMVKFFLDFSQDTLRPINMHFPWHDWLGLPPATVPTTQPEHGYLQPVLELSDYLSLVTWMSILFGLAFQTPLVVRLIIHMGFVQPKTLKKSRKYVFLVILIIAAIITPTPDVVNMMAMALPMYLLFEIGLLAGGKGRQRQTEIVDESAGGQKKT